MKLIQDISNYLAYWLDKLKIKNPIIFGLVQLILLYFYGLLDDGKIVIPTPEFLINVLSYLSIENGFSGLISNILLLLVAANGARTALRAKAVAEKKEAEK